MLIFFRSTHASRRAFSETLAHLPPMNYNLLIIFIIIGGQVRGQVGGKWGKWGASEYNRETTCPLAQAIELNKEKMTRGRVRGLPLNITCPPYFIMNNSQLLMRGAWGASENNSHPSMITVTFGEFARKMRISFAIDGLQSLCREFNYPFAIDGIPKAGKFSAGISDPLQRRPACIPPTTGGMDFPYGCTRPRLISEPTQNIFIDVVQPVVIDWEGIESGISLQLVTPWDLVHCLLLIVGTMLEREPMNLIDQRAGQWIESMLLLISRVRSMVITYALCLNISASRAPGRRFLFPLRKRRVASIIYFRFLFLNTMLR